MSEITNCRLGAKITLEQCRTRQLRMRRYSTGGRLDARFLSCLTCSNWIPDGEYFEIKKSLKGKETWVWNGHALAAKRGGTTIVARNDSR